MMRTRPALAMRRPREPQSPVGIARLDSATVGALFEYNVDICGLFDNLSLVKSEIRQMANHTNPPTVCAYVHARALSAPGFAARLALAPDLRVAEMRPQRHRTGSSGVTNGFSPSPTHPQLTALHAEAFGPNAGPLGRTVYQRANASSRPSSATRRRPTSRWRSARSAR